MCASANSWHRPTSLLPAEDDATHSMTHSTTRRTIMSEGFSRRELVTGAAALMLGEKLAAQEAGSPQKKTYQVELAVPKVVTITVSFDARNRTIVASPDNGSARLNMDDTLVIISHETFTVQFTPL